VLSSSLGNQPHRFFKDFQNSLPVVQMITLVADYPSDSACPLKFDTDLPLVTGDLWFREGQIFTSVTVVPYFLAIAWLDEYLVIE
ncbi:hypothetical protein ACFL17_01830, partial [Pseudomonadota bacterium]